jgi:hypothetical protein
MKVLEANVKNLQSPAVKPVAPTGGLPTADEVVESAACHHYPTPRVFQRMAQRFIFVNSRAAGSETPQ